MSQTGHWVYNTVIAGHHMSFNLDTIFTMWFAMGVIIIFGLIATRKLSVFPNKIQAACENVMQFFWGTLDTMIPNKNRQHVPIVASLFLFILTANLMGQLPLRIIHLKTGELASPTNDLNLTAAMAIIVLLYYLFMGFKTKGFKYLLHEFSFTGIIMALVEILEMITRPLSLAIRLFANIFAGEILVSVALGLSAYLLPLPVMLFEILVAFIQATVFMMLTIAYISSATGEEH
ncbi:TPA: F0F1 ATP synthase subunit A [Candidatus Scatousia excrementigallinarum]|uniref:ATP synthase subunit a n=1 Tax=Candidatus Scatousia excrementigallinarum TaxID=2840935 RepID=A0A9D1EZI5_9BACT|nr:F0F1 ATP synthase subunit A [Candidatus Scatousia excrementigallinarum]